MGNRIRTIWALSLASAMLLIGMQGYWLYNQYQYVVDVYAQDLSEKILDAGEKEFKIRNSNKSSTPDFSANDFNVDSIYEGSLEKNMVLHHYSGSPRKIYLFDARTSESELEIRTSNLMMKFLPPDSAKRIGDSLENVPESINLFQRRLVDFKKDSSANVENSVRYFLVNKNIPKEYINKGVEQAMINDRVPFCMESFDSILVADIPEVEYKLSPMIEQDSLVLSSWHLSGSLFFPRVKVLYVYSIFENKGIEIDAVIPLPTLLKSMAVQLLLSLTLILLLTGCLILQI